MLWAGLIGGLIVSLLIMYLGWRLVRSLDGGSGEGPPRDPQIRKVKKGESRKPPSGK